MQTNPLSSNFTFSANLTLDKVKNQQQETDFADRLGRIMNAQEQTAGEDAKLRQVCQDMEAVFLNIMLKQMRATVPKTNLMGDNNNATDICQSMLDSEMTKDMAKAGGIGLGDMLYRQLSPAKSKITNSPSMRPAQQTAE